MVINIENCELRSYEFKNRKDNSGQYLVFRFEDSDGVQHSAMTKDNSLVDKFDKGLNCTIKANLYICSEYTNLTILDFV